MDFVREDDSDRLLCIRCGADTDVGNVVAAFVDRFETLQSDVLYGAKYLEIE